MIDTLSPSHILCWDCVVRFFFLNSLSLFFFYTIFYGKMFINNIVIDENIFHSVEPKYVHCTAFARKSMASARVWKLAAAKTHQNGYITKPAIFYIALTSWYHRISVDKFDLRWTDFWNVSFSANIGEKYPRKVERKNYFILIAHRRNAHYK